MQERVSVSHLLGNKNHNKGITQTNLFVLYVHIHQLFFFLYYPYVPTHQDI